MYGVLTVDRDAYCRFGSGAIYRHLDEGHAHFSRERTHRVAASGRAKCGSTKFDSDPTFASPPTDVEADIGHRTSCSEGISLRGCAASHSLPPLLPPWRQRHCSAPALP